MRCLRCRAAAKKQLKQSSVIRYKKQTAYKPPPTRRGRSSSRGTQFSIKNEQIKPTEVIDYKQLTGYYSSNSKLMQDDMKFLFDQLQTVKLQRDESWSRNRFLESKMQDIHGHVKEIFDTRLLQEQSFMKLLKKEKSTSKKRIQELQARLSIRESLLGEWVQLSRAIASAIKTDGADPRYDSTIDDLVLRTLSIMPEGIEGGGITLTSFPLSGNRSDDERMNFIKRSLSNAIAGERGDAVTTGSQFTNNETRRDGNKKSRTKKSPVRDDSANSAAGATIQTAALRQEEEKVVVREKETRPVSASRRSKRSKDVYVLQYGPMQSCAIESDSRADKVGEEKPIPRQVSRAEKQKALLDDAQTDGQIKSLLLSAAQSPSLPTAGCERSDNSDKEISLDIANIQNRISEALLIDVQEEHADGDSDLCLDYSSDDTPFAHLTSGDVFAETAGHSDSRQ